MRLLTFYNLLLYQNKIIIGRIKLKVTKKYCFHIQLYLFYDIIIKRGEMMSNFKIGEIIKIRVIGVQNYGLFVRSLDNEEYTGLIHISEISSDYIKDISKIAKVDDILYAKILDVDEKTKTH
jgi:Predicted RNA binding protein (contains ribosomal protein S1 domain)